MTHLSSSHSAARILPKALLAVTVGLALASCSNSDNAATDGTTAITETLNLYNWSEYMPQEILDGFTEETGIRVNYTTFDSNDCQVSSTLSSNPASCLRFSR